MEYFYFLCYRLFFSEVSASCLLPPGRPSVRLRKKKLFVSADGNTEKQKLETHPSSLAPFLILLLLLRPPAAGRLVGVDVGNGRTEARGSLLWPRLLPCGERGAPRPRQRQPSLRESASRRSKVTPQQLHLLAGWALLALLLNTHISPQQTELWHWSTAALLEGRKTELTVKKLNKPDIRNILLTLQWEVLSIFRPTMSKINQNVLPGLKNPLTPQTVWHRAGDDR